MPTEFSASTGSEEGHRRSPVASPVLSLGRRTVLAATCRKCGKLKQGKEFDFRVRNARDKWPYIDQRCTNCKWGAKLKGKVQP